MRELQWFNMVTGLRDFIKYYKYYDGRQLFDYLVDRDSFKIVIGKGITGEYPRLDILLGDETPLDKEKQSEITGATIQLWLDLYIKGASDELSEDGEMLYRQSFLAENELIKILNEYTKVLSKDYGIAVNLKVSGILSDGDENSPINIQHRIVLDIEWRR